MHTQVIELFKEIPVDKLTELLVHIDCINSVNTIEVDNGVLLIVHVLEITEDSCIAGILCPLSENVLELKGENPNMFCYILCMIIYTIYRGGYLLKN